MLSSLRALPLTLLSIGPNRCYLRGGMRFPGKDLGTLSRQHQRIGEYLMRNSARIPVLTVEELAEAIGRAW